MKNVRVILVSNVPPRTVWRLAQRIEREIPEVRICGIVQQQPPETAGSLPKVYGWCRRGAIRLGDWLLRVIHACPPNPNGPTQFALRNLMENCHEADVALLIPKDDREAEILDFVGRQGPQIGVFAGKSTENPGLLAIPSCGWVRIHASSQIASPPEASATRDPSGDCKAGVVLEVEHLGPSSVSSPLATVGIPSQPYDTPSGLALKTNLITSDLLVQTVRCLATGTPAQAAGRVQAWAREMYFMHLRRVGNDPAGDPSPATSTWRTRPPWKLYLLSLLLISPYVLVRNWYRRWRGRYPVVILFHHLVSDRYHRMGMPTEIFLREAQFLRKHYQLVSLDQAIKLLHSGSVKTPTVALTFDDGYEDNFVSLRAVAEEIGAPVTMFVCTQVVEERREFQHDRATGQIGFLPLTWEQIRYWSANGAEFGSHTRSHYNCASIDPAALETEIVGSKKDLEASLGKAVRFFAFPWGKAENMSQPAVELATSTYTSCFSTLGGENFGRRGKLSQPLGRKGLASDPWELELSLQSIFELARWVKRSPSPRQNGPLAEYS